MLIDLLTDIRLEVLRNSDVDVLVDGSVNVLADVTTAFEFAISGPLEKVRCRAAFGCRSMAASAFVNVLQAWMPSCHV